MSMTFGQTADFLEFSGKPCQHSSMNQAVTKTMLSELTVSERLSLLEATWASLQESPENVPVPDWHKAELDRRLASLGTIDANAKEWSEVKRALLASLRS